jgi:hypothetical protein
VNNLTFRIRDLRFEIPARTSGGVRSHRAPNVKMIKFKIQWLSKTLLPTCLDVG